MKKQNSPEREKQIRFAEAGILFVLVLGIAVFVGMQYQSGDEIELAPETAAVTVIEEPVETEPDLAITGGPEAVEEPAVVEPEPEPVVVTYAMAETVYHEGHYAEASDLFSRYVDEHPDNAWGLYMLGLSEWKAGHALDADESFAAALEIAPDHGKALVNHARVLLDLERDDEAAARIETALAVDPDSREARRVQARIHHRQGRLDDAEAAYGILLRTDRDDVWALNNLGLVLLEQERFDEALAPLARAADLADAACISNNLGIALERTGHYAAAAEAYEAAVARDADYARAETSLERVEGLGDDMADEPVDLAALADGFTVDPVAPADTEADLAVAAVMATADPEPAAPEKDDNPE